MYNFLIPASSSLTADDKVEEPGVLSTVVLSGVIVDVCIDRVLCLINNSQQTFCFNVLYPPGDVNNL